MNPLLYLDTNIFIQAFELASPVAEPARRLLEAIEMRQGSAITSELTIAELLAPTSREGSLLVEARRAMYEAVLDRPAIRLVEVTREILTATAALRQQHPQRLPDAIHAVTAIAIRCRFMVSNDRDLRRIPPALEPVRADPEGVARLIGMLHG